VLGGKEWVFDFRDNPTIADPERYLKDQLNIYSGVFADRMLKNIWGMPEGSVFPEWDDGATKDIIIDPDRKINYQKIGALDPGFSHYTAYIVGWYDWHAAKYVVDSELFLKQINTEELAKEIKQLESKYPEGVYHRVSDTAAQVICDLAQLHNLYFAPTLKDNLEAQINYVRTMIKQRRLVINPACTMLQAQLSACSWNRSRNKFEESTQFGHFDLCSALIYFMRNVDTYTSQRADVFDYNEIGAGYGILKNREQNIVDAFYN
jgi:hypothetical protein